MYHGKTNVSLLQSRSVIRSIACHCNNVAMFRQLAMDDARDQRVFVLRCGPSKNPQVWPQAIELILVNLKKLWEKTLKKLKNNLRKKQQEI